MSPERVRQIEDLFHAALERSPEERAVLLAQAEPELRREVESLLGQTGGAMLERPTIQAAGVLPRDFTVKVLTAGAYLGPYRIERKLGEGGMGEVYQAVDTRLGRFVAIKVAHQQFSTRFDREARAISSLNHPNICTVYDVGPNYLVMELVEGETLAALIKMGRLPIKAVLRYGAQIAAALAEAHSKFIIHRDLKPGNIMLAKNGAKVLDFGLAKSQNSETLTASRVVMGTPAYMPPEQREGRGCDARTDIYALGLILYEMATSKRPPQDHAVTVDALPERLAHVIQRCLEQEPDRRWQTARDVQLELEWIANAPVEPAQSPTELPRLRLLPSVIAAALAVALVMGGAVWWLKGSRISTPGRAPALTRLTFDSGFTSEPAISPDGKLIAYASDRGVVSGDATGLDIWVQQIETGERLRLTSNAADEREPAFSPDGSRIAYRSEQEGGGIYLVSSLGGEARRIAREGRTPRFSPSGESIAYWTGGLSYQGLIQGKIYVASESGGQTRQVQPAFHSASFPVWSPDGKRLLFLGARDSGDSESQANELDWWITPLEGGRDSAIKTGALPALRRLKFPAGGFGVWIAPSVWMLDAKGRNVVVFSAFSGGDASNVWQIPISGKTWRVVGGPERLTFGAGLELMPSVAPLTGGGFRLVLASLSEGMDIWYLPLDANRGVVTGALRRITHEGVAGRPSVSLDGKRVAYTKGLLPPGLFQNKVDIRLINPANGEEARLADGWSARITLDGGRVAYSANGPGEAGRLFALSSAGADPEPICNDCFLATAWNHDGTKLLDESVGGKSIGLVLPGRSQRIPLVMGFRYALSAARFSPDDRWIAFHAIPTPTTRRIFVVPFHDPSQPGVTPVEEKDWIPITDGAGMERYAAWSPDGNLLYFISERDGFRCLRAQRLDPATKRPIGPPVDVYHFHSARQSLLAAGDPVNVNPAVAVDKIVFGMVETTGNIWMTELPKEK